MATVLTTARFLKQNSPISICSGDLGGNLNVGQMLNNDYKNKKDAIPASLSPRTKENGGMGVSLKP